MSTLPTEPEEESEALERLYSDFANQNLAPLWTQTAGLMPMFPAPEAQPYCWSWELLLAMARRAGALVPVGRGGERRAIALANPGLGGRPFISPTLWAAVQYLGPEEVAPAHRHSQGAFRFVLEGEGVWTVVDGDPVAMRRGDLLLTPGMSWHEHQNASSDPMVWMDGLDIPLVHGLDAGFFEFGPDELTDASMPAVSRSERLWGRAGIQPISGLGAKPHSPLVAYRWEHSDAALAAQLELEEEGHPATVEPGHAGIRFTNPTTGGDALPTIRTEMHRFRAETQTARRREAGSSVWQVFEGEGSIELDGAVTDLRHGDIVVVPSWCPHAISAHTNLDMFMFGDAPIFEALKLARHEVLGVPSDHLTD